MPCFHVQWVTFLPSHHYFQKFLLHHLHPVQTDNLEIFSLERSVSTWTIYELTDGAYKVLQRDRENLGESRFRQERKTAKSYRHSLSDFSDESFIIEKEKVELFYTHTCIPA